MLRVGGFIVCVAIVAALAGPVLWPHDPATQELARRLEAPSLSHPLGLDELGRDILARMTRASVLEELHELYVLAARARGVSGARAVVRHAFRNSLIPIVTIIGLQFGAVLTGTIITETIFAWPGIGRLLIQAINFRDYPLVQGCILFISITYVAMNLLTDLTYGLLDPRIRYD